MEYAIKYEKIDLGGEKVVYKPVSVIKGNYDPLNKCFETDFGEYYDSMGTFDFVNNDCFANATNLDLLKQKYQLEDESELLTCYFNEQRNNYYLGFLDLKLDKVNVVCLPLGSVQNAYKEGIENTKKSIKLAANKETAPLDVFFSMSTIEELLSIDNIDDIKSFLREVLDSGEKLINSEETEFSKEEQAETSIPLQKEKTEKFNLKELRKEVLENIIGQNETVYDVTRALAINYTSKNPRNKSHILITGPSGTGKTEIINIIAKKLDLPVFKADATAYTKSGYVGKDVQSMLAGLIEAADGDLEKAQRGILIIDEIDKKSSDSKDDVSGKSVLHSLLKIMDRDVMEVDMGMYDTELFDTSNITMVFMGSFDELHKEKQENKKFESKSIGFSTAPTKKEEPKIDTRLTEDDLVKWLGPEFVGRLGLITSTKELSIEKVVEILHSSKISQLKTIKEDLADRGIKLLYTSGYLKEIAKRGTSKETGVRKLNKVVKENLKYVYDDILINGEPKTLMLTMRTAKNGRIYKKNN